jgi:hypothetical protein
MRPRLLLTSSVTALACTACAAQSPPAPADKPPPCAAAEHRQFDFWIGTWDVYQPDGKLAGQNVIESVLGGCALRETWSSRGGFAGISLNAWDRDDRRWHQSWFDNQGGRLELAGQRVGDAMQLGSAAPHPDKPGATRRQRISWTPLPDGAVRQLWETSDDDGASWRVVFDGRYVKRR